MASKKQIPNPTGFDLNTLPKENIFNTPDRYFYKLPSQIQERVQAPASSRFELSGLFSQYKLAYVLPAVLLLFVGFILFNNDSSNLNSGELLSEVSSEAIIDYLEEYNVSDAEIVNAGILAFETEPNTLSLEDELLLDELSLEDFEDFI